MRPADRKLATELVEQDALHRRVFLARAYRRPVAEADVQRFLSLFAERHGAGLANSTRP